MKLAEALIERRDLQNKLLELKNLMLANTLVEEGNEPDIAVADLLRQYDQVSKQLEELIVAITKRNQEIWITVEGEKHTLQGLLAKRGRKNTICILVFWKICGKIDVLVEMRFV